MAKMKITTDADDDAGKKKQSKVERALLAAWGTSMAQDDLDEEAERERELAIQEELQLQKLLMRDQLHVLMRGQQAIDKDTLSVMKNQLQGHNNGAFFRDTLCEVLNEVSTGKQLENPTCLQAIGELIKVTLTCLERDPQEDDYKMFYTIIESSSNLFSQ